MSDTREKIAPCPFCGGTPRLLPPTCEPSTPYNPRDRLFPIVRCSCGASVPGSNEDYREDERSSAVVAWNRRALIHEDREPVAWDATWSHSTDRTTRLPAPRGPWRTEEEARAFVQRFSPAFRPECFPLYASSTPTTSEPWRGYSEPCEACGAPAGVVCPEPSEECRKVCSCPTCAPTTEDA